MIPKNAVRMRRTVPKWLSPPALQSTSLKGKESSDIVILQPPRKRGLCFYSPLPGGSNSVNKHSRHEARTYTKSS